MNLLRVSTEDHKLTASEDFREEFSWARKLSGMPNNILQQNTNLRLQLLQGDEEVEATEKHPHRIQGTC